jgi:integrase
MRENVRVAFRAENTSAMRLRRWDQETVKYHTKEEVERLFDQIDDPRDLLLFDLIYRHGLRRKEAALLTLDDFREERIWIWRVKHGKSCGYRLHERTLLLYQRYLAVRPDDGTPYLFRSRRRSSQPLSGGEINRLFHKYALAAGLPQDRAHVHSLRHSIAVHLAEIGWTPADVQYWLGHRDIKSTMVYFRITDRRAELLHEAMRQSDGIARTGH